MIQIFYQDPLSSAVRYAIALLLTDLPPNSVGCCFHCDCTTEDLALHCQVSLTLTPGAHFSPHSSPGCLMEVLLAEPASNAPCIGILIMLQ